MSFDRESRFLRCGGFQLLGGRRGVPGKIDEVPWFAYIPGWFSEQAKELFEGAGVHPLAIHENRQVGQHDDGRELPEDLFVFAIDSDRNVLDGALNRAWELAVKLHKEQ